MIEKPLSTNENNNKTTHFQQVYFRRSLWVSHLVERVAHVAVTLEEVEDGLPEDLEGEAHVAEVVEAVEHPDTEVLPLGVLGRDTRSQHLYFTHKYC